MRWVEEKVGQENIVARKRVAYKPDSDLLGSGVGFEKETWDHWTVEEMKQVISGK